MKICHNDGVRADRGDYFVGKPSDFEFHPAEDPLHRRLWDLIGMARARGIEPFEEFHQLDPRGMIVAIADALGMAEPEDALLTEVSLDELLGERRRWCGTPDLEEQATDD